MAFGTQAFADAGKKKCSSCKSDGPCTCGKKSSALPSHTRGLVEDAIRTPGARLDEGTRRSAEPSFAHDFSNVRVHSGAPARRAADAVDARAFTVGSDIVLGEPRANRGGSVDPVLAHELAHVVQQSRYHHAPGAPLSVSSPGESEEREADEAGRRVNTGASADIGAKVSGKLQRQEKMIDLNPCPAVPAAKATEESMAGPDAEFADCDDNQKFIIKRALRVGKEWTENAMAAISKFGSKVAPHKDHFAKEFNFSPDSDPERVAKVATNFQTIRNGFDEKIPFVCDPKQPRVEVNKRERCPPGSTDSRFLGCGGAIRLYPRFFNENLGPGLEEASRKKEAQEQPLTVIHEMAHRYAGLDDKAYSDDKVYETLSPDQAIDNADSYAQFAKDVATK